MKKILLTLLLLIPLEVYATEYKATINGNSTLYSYPFDIQQTDKYIKPNYLYGTFLNINVTNIENIKKVTIRVKYDYNKISLLACHELNYIGEPCSVHDNIIYHTFYEHKLKEDNLKKDLFSVHFIPIEKTPDTGTTEVKIYFENAIDKEGNEILIEPITKTYNFKNYKKKYQITQVIPDDISKENNEQDKNSETNNNNNENIQETKNEEVTITEKTNSNIKDENKPTNQTTKKNIIPKTNQEKTSSANNNIDETGNNLNNQITSNDVDTNIKTEVKETPQTSKQKKSLIKYTIIIITASLLILTFILLLQKKKNITKK